MWWQEPVWLLLLLLILPLLILGNFEWVNKIFKNLPVKKNDDFKLNKILKKLTGLRIAIIIIMILALAGTSVLFPVKRREIVLLIDISKSISNVQLDKSRASAFEILKKLNRNDRISIMTFSGNTELLTESAAIPEAVKVLESASFSSSRRDSQNLTDISMALLAGSEILNDKNGEKSFILISDGRSTSGEPVIKALERSVTYPVYTVSSGISENAVLSKEFNMPEMVHQFENVSSEWKVVSDEDRNINSILKIDDKTIETKKINLKKGSNTIKYNINTGSSGVHRVTLQVKSDDGKNLDQAEIQRLFVVSGPAKILVINGNAFASPMVHALTVQGFSVDAKSIESLPETASGYAGYQAVVLDNVHALYISESQQDELQNYVSGGGGLLVIGGDKSLGRGDYFDTPLEDMLPVETDVRQRLFFARSSILFVIDHSGSMTEMVGKTSKQIAAMNGVAASIKELDPLDEVGILTFDETPTWALPFTQVRNADAIMEALANLQEGGGTNMDNAFKEIIKSFFDQGPRKRHVVILTDGMTGDANFQEMTKKLSSLGVTTTTIGIGEEVNEELLKNIAGWGNGKYYRANLDQIPRVISRETLRITRELMQEGNFRILMNEKSAMTDGLSEKEENISGYIITKSKKMAGVFLETRNKEMPEQKDPILAAWRYGNGNVAVFTSDSGRRWLSSWSGKPAVNRLWAQIIRNIQRGSLDQGLRVNSIIEAGNVHISVDAIGEDRKLKTGLKIEGRQLDAGGLTVNFNEILPGHYEAYMPFDRTGLLEYEIKDVTENTIAHSWAWNSTDMELSNSGPDTGMLESIGNMTGGRFLAEGEYVLPVTRWSLAHVRIDLFLLFSALILFITELFLRSTSFGQLAMVKALFSVWLSAQKRIIDVVRNLKLQVPVASNDDIDQKKIMDAYRYLANRISERNSKEKGDDK